MFIDYLIHDTQDTLEDLKRFVTKAEQILSVDPTLESFEETMKVQQEIEVRSKTIDRMFGPIKEKSLVL